MHDAATKGFQKHAHVYQRVRPTYHRALVRRFIQRWDEDRVVELGAGTGIFSAQLLEAGVKVVAIEPVEAMRHSFSELVGIEVLEGTAQSIPLDDDSTDVVIAVQPFHWFDAPAGLDEIARVLRPDGHLVAAWNVLDERVRRVRSYWDVVGRHAGDTPRQRTMARRRSIDQDERFTFVDQWTVANPVRTDPQGVVDRALSTSFVATLDELGQEALASETRAIVADLGPQFEMTYRSQMQSWRCGEISLEQPDSPHASGRPLQG